MGLTGQVLELLQKNGMMRPRELASLGIPVSYLHRLHKRGLIMKLERGLYAPLSLDVTEHHSLALAGKQVPDGVICLLSALQFHNLTTQTPARVWLALANGKRKPEIAYPPLKIVLFSGDALTAGIEEHCIEGVTVKIYNPAKTVADCFKYRHKIGLDIAIEALKTCRAERKCSGDALWRYARICRVSKVMQPYLEMAG